MFRSAALKSAQESDRRKRGIGARVKYIGHIRRRFNTKHKTGKRVFFLATTVKYAVSHSRKEIYDSMVSFVSCPFPPFPFTQLQYYLITIMTELLKIKALSDCFVFFFFFLLRISSSSLGSVFLSFRQTSTR